MNNRYIKIAIMIMPVLLAFTCLVCVVRNHNQASMPIPRALTFTGEYSYDGENWYPYDENSDLSAVDGDLTVRGHFDEDIFEGEILNVYCNHIGVSISVNGQLVYMNAPAELRSYGLNLMTSMCGKRWEQIACPAIAAEDEVEFQLINYHKYGNKEAYKEILSTSFLAPLDTTILENFLKTYIIPFEMTGNTLLIIGIMMLGSALFAIVLRNGMSARLFKTGVMTLFLGGYIILDVMTINLGDELLVMKTYGSQLCLMLGVYFLGLYVCDELTGKHKKAAELAMGVSGIVNILLIAITISGKVLLYDTRIVWDVLQCVISLVLMTLCVLELKKEKSNRVLLITYVLVYGAILLDIAGVGYHRFYSGICFKVAFLVMLLIILLRSAKQVIMNGQASIKVKKLEKELEESRISVMLSQIQPHFLYNVLGTIRSLCRKDPEQAWRALGDFSKYLQANMSALENRQLIHFESELRHIETYLKLEKLRLGEKLSIVYDVQVSDFMLPPLTIQPLVENAVKHGIFHQPGGGEIVLRTRQEADQIIISVEDNGIGFDPDAPLQQDEEHAHVGLINVQSRLKKMTGGQMIIQSSLGKGTKVTVRISVNL